MLIEILGAAGRLVAITVVLFRKVHRAVVAFPRLELLVDLLDVLLDVAALAERLVAAWHRASEGLVLGMGTHVVDKFGPVRHDFVAAASELALEKLLTDFVALKAVEGEHDVLVSAREKVVVLWAGS